MIGTAAIAAAAHCTAHDGIAWCEQHLEKCTVTSAVDKTASPIKTVKMTIANNVQDGYKVVDAMQLVGD